MAAEIARAIFERDAEAIERAFTAALRKGDANVFKALADRAYGKPCQHLEHTSEGGGPLQSSVIVRFVKPGEVDDKP